MTQKAGDKHGQSAGCSACECLNDDCFGKRKRHRIATGGHHGRGQPLKKEAAESAGEKSDETVPCEAKLVLAGSARRRVSAQYPCNRLDNKVGNGPLPSLFTSTLIGEV